MNEQVVRLLVATLPERDASLSAVLELTLKPEPFSVSFVQGPRYVRYLPRYLKSTEQQDRSN